MPPKLYWWLVSIGWDNELVSSGITITWTNVDPDLRGHMASLGYGELIHWYCMIWMDKANMDNGIKRNKKEKIKQVNRLCAYINAHYLLRLHISYTRSNDISTNNGAPISETIDIQNNSRQLWDTPFAYLMLRKRWRATAWCGKSKFAISSGWLKTGSVSHPDDIITLP